MSQVDERLAAAARDERVIARYRAHLFVVTDGCWLWTGAISGAGHGRFWVQRGHVVIAHRFGWALAHPGEPLPALIGHRCDEPLCQRPDHLVASSPAQNLAEWAARRHQLGSPLRDARGAAGRARALRTAARTGANLDQAAAVGLRPIDRDQGMLW